MWALIIFTLLMQIIYADIVDYTREKYVLIENDDCAVYENYGSIFHVTNLTYYNELTLEHKGILNKLNKKPDSENQIANIEGEIEMIETLLEELKLNDRTKRGINELGTLWKWIAGTPDHDDFVKINEKINDLIINSNKQFMINSKLFNIINKLTDQFETNKEARGNMKIVRKRNRLILTDLTNLIHAISLAKVNILFTGILNLREIRQIMKIEEKRITLTDILDASSFKVVQTQDCVIVYIKYPIINKLCKLYDVRPINNNNTELKIEHEIVKCQNYFTNVKNCKQEIHNTYCKKADEETCLSKILNSKEAKCQIIVKKPKQVEIIKDGVILISGENIVNSTNLEGSYLITFDNNVNINNIRYENPTAIIKNYLKNNKIPIYDVTEIFNETIEFENINYLTLKDELSSSHHKLITIIIIFVLILTIYLSIKLRKYIKIYINKKKENVKRTEKELKEFALSELKRKVNELHESNERDPGRLS